LQKRLDAITEPWGNKVEQVQMKNVEIPPIMQNTMTIVMTPSKFVTLADALAKAALTK
jgi:regulator of protease activity HflC (stomatin/prohibitin superfamily)